MRGYSLNQRRLAEKGSEEVRRILSLLANTLEDHHLVNDEGRAVLNIVNRYTRTWQLLLQYDEENLPLPKTGHEVKASLEMEEAHQAITALKQELMSKGEASEIFGQERGHGLAGILGAVHQTDRKSVV